MKDSKTDIEAVIFDLGRVLVDIDTSRGIFRFFSQLLAGDDWLVMHKLMHHKVIREYNTGRLSSQGFYKRVRGEFSLDLDFDTFSRLWCDIFLPMPGMEGLVYDLKDKTALGLLSDTDPLHWNHLRSTYPHVAAIDKPTLSYEIGFGKPDKQCYLAAAANTGRPPEKCLFIDDLPANVEGAITAGMKSVQFQSADQIRRALEDYRIL
jgi:glucose-1-phosphatase